MPWLMPSPLAPSVTNDCPHGSKWCPHGLMKPRRKTSSCMCLGPELPDAAAVQPADAVGRFDVRMNVDRLVEIEHAVGPPAQRVQDVVRIFGAETGKDDRACYPPCRPASCRAGARARCCWRRRRRRRPGRCPWESASHRRRRDLVGFTRRPCVSSRIRILSLAFSPGLICG